VGTSFALVDHKSLVGSTGHMSVSAGAVLHADLLLALHEQRSAAWGLLQRCHDNLFWGIKCEGLIDALQRVTLVTLTFETSHLDYIFSLLLFYQVQLAA
jgi:hypothetical protein